MESRTLHPELSARILDLRLRRDLSQSELAEAWGISRSAVSQIENGERGVSSSELRKLTEIFKVSADYLLGLEDEPEVVLEFSKKTKKKCQSMRISVPAYKVDKFKNVLLYILERCGGKPNVGETVLYKLLYFADFNFYESYEEHLTGATYRRLQFGPAPLEFDEIVRDMISKKEIRVINSEYHGFSQRRYIPLEEKADLNELKASEKKILDDVIDRFSDKSAKWLSNFSHGDMPWKATAEKDVIDYELVFYRDPAYSVRDYIEEE